jgi:hypothetical protein
VEVIQLAAAADESRHARCRAAGRARYHESDSLYIYRRQGVQVIGALESHSR